MRKVVFAINGTADGYYSHTDMLPDEELNEYFFGIFRDVSVMLLGRNTYHLMIPYWPDIARNQSETKAENEFALLFDSFDKVVFSTTLKKVEGTNTRIARSTVAEEVMTLKQKPGKDICAGSLSIASQLSVHGLIDEYHIAIHPVIAGKGPRWFETVKLKEKCRLDLVGSRTFRSGVVVLHYRKHS